MFGKKKEQDADSAPDVAVAEIDEAVDDTAVAGAAGEAEGAGAAVAADDPGTPEAAESPEADAETAAAVEPGAQEDVDAEDEDAEDEDDDVFGGDDLDISLDLMDIFESEQAETTSTAGAYADFLDELTMEDVYDYADVLLEELRTRLGSK